MKKLYITRKYIIAESINEAIRLDKKTQIDDIFLDDDWRKEQNNRKESSTGFLEKK